MGGPVAGHQLGKSTTGTEGNTPSQLEKKTTTPGGATDQQAGKTGPDKLPSDTLTSLQQSVHAGLVYPPVAEQMGMAGKTIIRVEITKYGKAVTTTLSSSGFPILDKAARDYLRDYPYPVQFHGHDFELTVSFSLD